MSLTWADVVENESLTFQRLKECNVPMKQLHVLQPDIAEWMQHGGVTLNNLPEMMHLWKAHPIRHMKADLGDLLMLKWGADLLRRMGVTVDDLKEIGLTADNMSMFGFSILGWMTLGFRVRDAETMTDPQIARNFGMTRQNALQCLRDSQPIVAIPI